MLVAFILAAVLQVDAQYLDDEENYFRKYQDSKEQDKVVDDKIPLGKSNGRWNYNSEPTSPVPRTLSDEEISHVKDVLRWLLPHYDLGEAITTIQEWKDTTTSWYTVKDILAGILKEINEAQSKATDNTPTPIKCLACTRQTLSLFGVNSNEDRCTERENDNEDDIEEFTTDNIREGTKNEENENYDYETQNRISVDKVTAQERYFTNQIGGNSEEVYVYETPTYWHQMEQVFDLNKLNRSQNIIAKNNFYGLLIDRAKRDYFDSEENTTKIKTVQSMPFSLDRLKQSFGDPLLLGKLNSIGRQGKKTPTTERRKNKSKRRRTTTTRSRRRRTKWTAMVTSQQMQPRVDVAKLVELITNLTKDYSETLTNKVRAELDRVGLPACNDTADESTEVSVTGRHDDPYANLTGTIMGKCFVCGLTDRTMPRIASCADAFAGDFIPLVQVDQSARKNLANYRKYCRWMNVPKYIINETDPRSMWGRWTGGCSVRWIDISGIYTQRTCRNRHRAVMGKHWVSKRMAKLEMALQNQDNGCIISPMASLVPLSRGISLYARFHACVCTGSWCNQSPPSAQCTPYIVGITTFLVMVIRTFLLEFGVRWNDAPRRRKIMLFTFY